MNEKRTALKIACALKSIGCELDITTVGELNSVITSAV